MNELNKIFEYNGYKFNIKVELNWRVERRINGLREHRITINDMGPSNYNKQYTCDSNLLESTISLAETAMIDYVDKRELNTSSNDIVMLKKLGFEFRT